MPTRPLTIVAADAAVIAACQEAARQVGDAISAVTVFDDLAAL